MRASLTLAWLCRHAPLGLAWLCRHAPLGLATLACLAAVGCTPGRTTNGSSSSGAEGHSDDRCSAKAMGLGDAKPVTRWTPPTGCKLRGGGGSMTTFAQTEDELGALVECSGTTPGIDLTKNVLAVRWQTLSPAQIGTDVVDDGKTLTFVARQRSPCPRDPLPMPISVPITFLLPAGATREVKDAACTLPPSCT